jgi:hypothetical protein
MQVAHATPTTSCPFQRFHSEWSYECTGTFVHKSLSFRKTTFRTSLTNLTAFPSQSHKWQLLRKQTYAGTSTMIYANTAWCTLPPCDIRRSSLRYLRLKLDASWNYSCYTPNRVNVFERGLTLPGRSELSLVATTSQHLQLCTVSGTSLASYVVLITAPRIPVFKFPGAVLYQQFAGYSRVARSHITSLSRTVALSAG